MSLYACTQSALLAGSVALSAAHAATYHLAPPPLGNDAHPGTTNKPWATFARAVPALGPGDTLVVRGGTYAITNHVSVACTGAPSAWITIAGHDGEAVVIDASGCLPARRQHTGGAIHVQNASYVRIRNISVRNSHAAGILVRGPRTHHIDILDCCVDRTYCPGIGVWNAEHIRVIGCEVTGANMQEMRPPGARRGREAPHEAISIAGVRFFDVASNHVHHCEKEGIDVKEVSAHGRVHHNHVHHVRRQGLYVDAWFGLLEDIEFDHNLSESNAFFGMAVSVECRDSELRDVRIHDNVFRRNGGSGLFFSVWGVDGPRSGIDVRDNIIIGNGGRLAWAGPTGGIDMKTRNCRDVLITGNLCVSNAQFQIATFDNPADGLDELAAQNIVITNNCAFPFVDDTDHDSPYGRVYALPSAHSATNTPL